MDKKRILIVEDDAHLLSGIREILELENYNVMTAKNGREALGLLDDHVYTPPDVIVSDIMMPHMDGMEFLEAVRERDEFVHVPFIFLTAKGERKDRNAGVQMGADHYLTKPFDAPDLIVAVSAALKRQTDMKVVKHRQMSEQKRKILTILNHEFRTPLTLVVAYAEMLKDFDPDNKSDEEVMTFLKGVNSGADRLRRLIENFIVLVELDTGEAEKTFEWRKRPVDDISYLIQDAQRQVEREDRPRRFLINIPSRIPTIEIDSQYFTIALRELLDNAAKFTRDEGEIRLEMDEEGEYVRFDLFDNGRGIPAHETDNVWQPFYQIDREQHEDQGSGSGLSIVDGIVKLHDGKRQIRPRPDGGTIVSIWVPKLQPQA